MTEKDKPILPSEEQPEPEHLVLIPANRKETRDMELLLLSKAIPFTCENYSGRNEYHIPVEYKESALKEWNLYQKENQNWPPVFNLFSERLLPFSSLNFLVLGCLSLFHWITRHLIFSVDWMESGHFAAEKVLNHEWFRLVTALTLHMDDAHFLSNFFGLLVFVGILNKYLGYGLAWLFTLLAGAGGNYLSAIFYQTAHNSVGASTAVFGAIGLIGALAIPYHRQTQAIKNRLLISLAGAVGIFAMLGTNPQTDVMAHLFGLISGIGLGLCCLPLTRARKIENPLLQAIALLVFFACLGFSWFRALHG